MLLINVRLPILGLHHFSRIGKQSKIGINVYKEEPEKVKIVRCQENQKYRECLALEMEKRK